jgi:hypothetical protein
MNTFRNEHRDVTTIRAIMPAILFLIALTASAFGQYKAGDVELQFAGNMGSYYSVHRYNVYVERTYKYALVSVSSGYYVMDGGAVEFAFDLYAMEKWQPIKQYVLGFSYTQVINDFPIAPFGRIGLGLNSVDWPQGYIWESGGIADGLNDLAAYFNLGIGAKALVSKHAAVKVELNIRAASTDRDSFSNSSLLFGVSLIL